MAGAASVEGEKVRLAYSAGLGGIKRGKGRVAKRVLFAAENGGKLGFIVLLAPKAQKLLPGEKLAKIFDF